MNHYKFSLESKTFEVTTYSLDELIESSRQTAIDDHIEFLNEVEYDSYFNEEEDDDEDTTIYQTEEYAINSIMANDYEFDFNGKLVGITKYMKDNKPTGKKTIRINKQEIDLIQLTNN